MAYMYRNLKTKETITTSNKVFGKNWEQIEDDPEVPGTEEASEETVEEEAPAAPPKASRRGKK